MSLFHCSHRMSCLALQGSLDVLGSARIQSLTSAVFDSVFLEFFSKLNDSMILCLDCTPVSMGFLQQPGLGGVVLSFETERLISQAGGIRGKFKAFPEDDLTPRDHLLGFKFS